MIWVWLIIHLNEVLIVLYKHHSYAQLLCFLVFLVTPIFSFKIRPFKISISLKVLNWHTCTTHVYVNFRKIASSLRAESPQINNRLKPEGLAKGQSPLFKILRALVSLKFIALTGHVLVTEYSWPYCLLRLDPTQNHQQNRTSNICSLRKSVCCCSYCKVEKSTTSSAWEHIYVV